MISFSYKKIGYLIVASEIILLLLAFIPVFSFLKVDEKSGSVFGWLLLSGLVTITFSKEKYETDEIEVLRLKCFFRSFFAALSAIVVGSLLNLFIPGKAITFERALEYLDDNSLLKFCVVALTLHLIFFWKGLKTL